MQPGFGKEAQLCATLGSSSNSSDDQLWIQDVAGLDVAKHFVAVEPPVPKIVALIRT